MSDDWLSNGWLVEIVYCIDLTNKMEAVLSNVKEFILKNNEAIRKTAFDSSGRMVEELYARIIGFRDFYLDCDDALVQSSFFNMQEKQKAFQTFVSNLDAKGRADGYANALEALALGIQSDWKKTTKRRRLQIIYLFTNSSPYHLRRYKSVPVSSTRTICQSHIWNLSIGGMERPVLFTMV